MYVVEIGTIYGAARNMRRQYRTLRGAQQFLHRERNDWRESGVPVVNVRSIDRLGSDAFLAEGKTVCVFHDTMTRYWISLVTEPTYFVRHYTNGWLKREDEMVAEHLITLDALATVLGQHYADMIVAGRTVKLRPIRMWDVLDMPFPVVVAVLDNGDDIIVGRHV